MLYLMQQNIDCVALVQLRRLSGRRVQGGRLFGKIVRTCVVLYAGEFRAKSFFGTLLSINHNNIQKNL